MSRSMDMDHDGGEELRVLRERVAELEEWVARLEAQLAEDGHALLVATVAAGAYPTAPGVFYAVQRQTVGGVETEGGTPTYTPGEDTFFAAHLGTVAPPEGTKALAIHVADRWVFQA